MSNNEGIEVVLAMLKETNDSMARMRQSNHDIATEMNGINGQLNIILNEQKRCKEDINSILANQTKHESEVRALENKVITLEKDFEAADEKLKAIEDIKKQIRNTVIGIMITALYATIGHFK
jgi:chromosome segregation ATPase